MAQKKTQKHPRWFWPIFLSILFVAIFVRFFQVTKFPPSLYDEEIALGYDAYSILKTGKDHLGNPPPLVAFESYGDYKPALYFYLIVPTIAVFGLNEFAVRLPAMIVGVLIVVGVGLIAREVTGAEKRKALIMQLIAMGVTTISPWAIMFSRAGWEANIATCFVVWGVVFGLFHLRTQKWWWAAVTFLSFALSMYTYHSARVIAPFLALAMLLWWIAEKKLLQLKLKKNLLQYFFAGLFFLFLTAPIVLSLTNKTTQERFAETNIFADGHVVLMSNHYQEMADHAWWARFLYHRYVFYTKEFLANYLKHFSVDFLFVHGDTNLRHSVQFFGQLYLTEAVFVFLGLVFFLKNWRKPFAYLLFWLLIGITPAALTTAAPHALRTLPVMPVFLILISFGVWESVMEAKGFIEKNLPRLKKWAVVLPAILVVGSYALQFVGFWHFYSTVYPKRYSGGWQYGYQQIVEEVNRRRANFQHVYITREMDRPAMAYFFFSQTDPRKVQKIDKTLQQDHGAPLPFENISFINFAENAESGLVASTIGSMHHLQQLGRSIDQITEIDDPAGKPIWAVYKLD